MKANILSNIFKASLDRCRCIDGTVQWLYFVLCRCWRLYWASEESSCSLSNNHECQHSGMVGPLAFQSLMTVIGRNACPQNALHVCRAPPLPAYCCEEHADAGHTCRRHRAAREEQPRSLLELCTICDLFTALTSCSGKWYYNTSCAGRPLSERTDFIPTM